jgi:hypothetical protein
MRKRISALAPLVAAASFHWFWEFVRSLFYERGSRMLNPVIENISPDQLLQWGVSAVLASVGLYLFWKLREPRSFAEKHHTDDPQTEALDKEAYKQLVDFCMDWLLPSCEAQIEMQESVVRRLGNDDQISVLAGNGLRNCSKVPGFWENYINLSSGLLESPGPTIKFEGMVECIYELEQGYYKQFCQEGIAHARVAGVAPMGTGSSYTKWLRHHPRMIKEYEQIKRDIRFGKLHRLRPHRWGNFSDADFFPISHPT